MSFGMEGKCFDSEIPAHGPDVIGALFAALLDTLFTIAESLAT